MNKIYNILALFIAVIGLSSCERNDHINDGGKSQRYVDMTTYDFLKSHGKFDSLVSIIDRAGLKDLVNTQNLTFFASTDYSVTPYVRAKKQKKIVELGSENIDFGIKDISLPELDSLKIYMYDGALIREYLNRENQFFINRFGVIDNTRFMVKLRRVLEHTSYLDYVEYVNFTRVVGDVDEDLPAGSLILPQDRDLSYDCQTSGIITKTGVINVLSDNHRLMFNGESLGQ